MSKLPTRRTAEQTRKMIAAKLLEGDSVMRPPGAKNYSPSPAGSMISGTDLLRAKTKIDLMTDEADRRKVMNIFSTFTKYQALSMLLAPAGEWMKKYPQIVDEIAMEATLLDDVLEIHPRAS